MNKKYILVWIDDIEKHQSKLISCLKNYKDNYYYITIKNPEKLLFYPKGNNYTEVIILINTDVTKLSNEGHKRYKIQNHLLSFVNNGGLLIGTHDIIYRRVRNELLESAFGCTIINFKRFNKSIEYQINENYSDHPLLSGLSKTFFMCDNEICWGQWSPDSLSLAYSNINNKKIPTIVSKKYGKGSIIWLNSGDKQSEQCETISKPNIDFLSILMNAITFKNDIIQYNYKRKFKVISNN